MATNDEVFRMARNQNFAANFFRLPSQQQMAPEQAATTAQDICTYGCNLVFSIMWYFLFKGYSTDPAHFGLETECLILREDTLGITGLFFNLIVLNVVMIVLAGFVNKFVQALQWVYAVLKIATSLYTIIMGLYYVISITSDLGKDEKCGGLRTLSWVYVILFYVGIGICCCYCCCMICLVMATQMRSQ
jgi:hypothetical protein